MVCSAIFVTDVKGKIIISRNYRGDCPMSLADRFATYVQETDPFDQRPIFTEDGFTFVYIVWKVVLKRVLQGMSISGIFLTLLYYF